MPEPIEKCAVCAASPISTTGTLLPFDLDAVRPVLADHARKADPVGRAAQVRGVADQLVAVEVLGEELLAEGDGLGLLHLVEAVGLPHRLRRLDDEGRGLVVELVGVGLEPAVLGLLEGEGEGVEGLVRAEPDEAALAQVDVGLEDLGIALADAAVEAVAGDHQVGVVLRGQRLVVRGVGLEHQLDAEREAALLQDVEQPLAADAAEAVAARAHLAALEEHLDVVPVMELVADQRGRVGVGRREVGQRLVAQHHAPAEGVEGAVALDHRDLEGRPSGLHQEREVEAGGAAADAQHALQVRL